MATTIRLNETPEVVQTILQEIVTEFVSFTRLIRSIGITIAVSVIFATIMILTIRVFVWMQTDRKWVRSMMKKFYHGIDKVAEQYVCDRANSSDHDFASMAFNKLFGHPIEQASDVVVEVSGHCDTIIDPASVHQGAFAQPTNSGSTVMFGTIPINMPGPHLVAPVVDSPITDNDEASNEPQYGNVIVDDEPMRLKKHRRVHQPEEYALCIVAEIKCKLGLPQDTAANRLVIRRLALSIMAVHKVRPTHIKRIISLIVELVLIPDVDDNRAVELRHSTSAQQCRGPVGWQGRVRRWLGFQQAEPSFNA